MVKCNLWPCLIGVRRSNLDSADEMSKGWISVERACQEFKSDRVVDVNRPVKIDTAGTKPVLAYESTCGECSEVFDFPYAIVVFIRVCADVVDDMNTKLWWKRYWVHVGRKRGSREMRVGGGQCWSLGSRTLLHYKCCC